MHYLSSFLIACVALGTAVASDTETVLPDEKTQTTTPLPCVAPKIALTVQQQHQFERLHASNAVIIKNPADICDHGKTSIMRTTKNWEWTPTGIEKIEYVVFHNATGDCRFESKADVTVFVSNAAILDILARSAQEQTKCELVAETTKYDWAKR